MFREKDKLKNWIEQNWIRTEFIESKYDIEVNQFFDRLSDRPGLYAVQVDGNFLYVGKSNKSIRKRWRSHHKKRFLDFLLSYGKQVRFYYWCLPNLENLKTSNTKILETLEKELITQLSPLLNQRKG